MFSNVREWISPAMGSYIVHRLLYEDSDGFIEKLNFHIIIVANPDGYEYSRNTGKFFSNATFLHTYQLYIHFLSVNSFSPLLLVSM